MNDESSPARLQAAFSSAWERSEYASAYGEKAAVAVDKCKEAARRKNMKDLIYWSRALSLALYGKGG